MSPEVLAFFTRDEWWGSGGNTLSQLAILVVLLTGGMLLRLLVRQRRIRRQRQGLALVVGGWGTRGKSGSERKKAALVSALGARHISKTTGCDAMFILGYDLDEPAEYTLFRAHEKATIWEQTDLMALGAELEIDVFLWECMALQGDYTKILQQSWMRDDLSTITNSYPDHEDVQGPAGRDVAVSIANFTRPGGDIISAEESMHPIFRETADARGSGLAAVELENADLICPDIIDRYPYQAHPRNLSLVMDLGERLGLQPSFVLKEVADHIIPDLGVLKTYPEVEVHGRSVRFSNGMSANERAGTLHNWKRLGLEDPDRDRHEWVVGVVNNRADRIPRSKVFASLMVEDLSAHLFVGIGSNLSGLRSYYEEAVEARLERLELPADNVGRYLREVLRRDSTQLRRIARTPEELARRVAGILQVDEASCLEALSRESGAEEILAALAPLAPEADAEAQRFLRDEVERYARFLAHQGALEDAIRQGSGALAEWLRSHKRWYRDEALQSIHFVEEFGIRGRDLIETIARLLPPHCRAHLIGLQNIKGTGQDFAERWVRVGEIDAALSRLSSPDPLQRGQGIRYLNQLLDVAPFEAWLIRSRSEELHQELELETRQALLEVLERMEEIEKSSTVSPETEKGSGDGKKKRRSSPWSKAAAFLTRRLEEALDPLDSIRRSRRAKAILRDIGAQRISGAQARVLLKEVTKRQKGGWLKRSRGL